MNYPLITADLVKLKHNIDKLCALCHANGLTMAAVTKCVCAQPRITELINTTDVDFIADSRILNLAGIMTDKPRMLIRIPMPGEVQDVVANSEISLNSEIATIRLLGEAAKAQRRRHRIVLMVDMGDLREGVFFGDEAAIIKTAAAVLDFPELELYGVGVNLTCFGGIMPDKTNLGGLIMITERLRERFSIPIPMVSGGNSSTMGMIYAGEVPKGITNLRIGEAYLLGSDTSVGRLMNGYYGDAFTLSAALVEVQRKPSFPIGKAGANAFGEQVAFIDKGEMLRGILALGRQDTNTDGLVPRDKRIDILGGSSDHTILDLTRASEYRVGDTVDFTPDYGALLKAYTGRYIQKQYK
ncbi:MAG: alanine/ornithine racemase family PLP-dependent enzyme [Clostridia bacterium]